MASFRAAVLVTLFLLLTLISLPLQIVFVRLGLPWQKTFPSFYHRLVCKLIGARITVIGTPVQGGVLMAANHSGWLDIPLLSAVLPVSFIAKSEVGTWAFFGTLARLQRTIFVHRGERARAGEYRDRIVKRLKDGDALVIFPEGTSNDGNRVLPFKTALFSAAQLALGQTGEHARVQPVSITYAGLYGMPMGRESRPFFAWYGDMELVPHLWEAFAEGPIDVVIEFHAPLTIDEAGGRKPLAAAAEARVRAGVVRALSGSHRNTAPTQDEALQEALDGADDEEEAA